MNETIYLIRHAMPQQPYAGRYDLPPGPELSPHGRIQAGSLGQFLQDKAISRLYHSPLQRTVETAAILTDYLGRPSQPAEALAEWRQEETAVAVRERAVHFWQTQVAGNGRDQTTALVTHGGVIEQLLRYLSQERVDLNGHRYWGGATTPLAGVWRVRRPLADEAWEMELIFKPA